MLPRSVDIAPGRKNTFFFWLWYTWDTQFSERVRSRLLPPIIYILRLSIGVLDKRSKVETREVINYVITEIIWFFFLTL